MQTIIGTMRWGLGGEKLSEDAQIELIETAVGNGFTTFDSADIYGGYTTEAEFGNALQNSSVSREKVEIITKCGICYPSEKRPYKIKYYDTSSHHIRNSVEQSLRDLHTDYVDYLLIHRPNPLMHFEEVANTIQSLKAEQKIKHFGLSNFSVYEFEQLQKYIPLETHQISYSLTDYSPLYDGRLTQAQSMNFPIMAWSPLGSFFHGKISEELKISVKVFSEKYGCSENLILLAWICHHPAQIIPVVGTTQKERIAELSQLSEVQLEEEDWFLLLEQSRGKRVE